MSASVMIACSACDGSGKEEPGVECCGGQQCSVCCEVVGGLYVTRQCDECAGEGAIALTEEEAHVQSEESGDGCPVAECVLCAEESFDRHSSQGEDDGPDDVSYRREMHDAGRGHLVRS